MAEEQDCYIKVTRAQYVKWNELWLAVQRLANQWGDDGAHGTALTEALADAERKGEGEPKPIVPPPPTCDTCGQTATHWAHDWIIGALLPGRAYAIGHSPERAPVGEVRYGCDSHPVLSEQHRAELSR